jgi:very-short-patch-repair endonuclease
MQSELRSLIVARGGAIATHELHSAGLTKGAIEHEIRRGNLARARQGWYVNPDIHPDLVRAVRVGGRLSCRSALDLQGVWVVTDGLLHVTVDGNDCQLRSPNHARRRRAASDATVVHWRDAFERSRLIVDPVNAIEDLCSCADPELVCASADSLLHRDPRQWSRLAEMASRVPAAYRSALLGCDGVCESGTETLFWLRMHHWRPRRQLAIPGVGRVDFLFGDRLVVEVDGEEFHTDPFAFERDRHRDAVLSAMGFRVLRFSYRQVMERWPEVEAAVNAAILRGDHH